jgi:hypothetical protein
MAMKRLGLAVFLVALASASASASQASNADWGYVSYINPTADGYVYFLHAATTRGVLPGCANAAQPSRWGFNASTPAGQARLAVLLSAFGLNKKIYIYGSGSCNDSTELVDFFHTGD